MASKRGRRSWLTELEPTRCDEDHGAHRMTDLEVPDPEEPEAELTGRDRRVERRRLRAVRRKRKFEAKKDQKNHKKDDKKAKKGK